MNPNEMLKASYETTHIIRERKYSLYTFGDTRLPYYFVSRSELDSKDTVVREGNVVVEKPQILLPGTMGVFEGFEFDEDMGVDENDVQHLLIARKILLPSLKYTNHESNMEVLFEQRNKNGNWTGYTSNYMSIEVESENDLHNQICPVQLIEIKGETVFGKLI